MDERFTEMNELIEEISKHNRQYYTLDQPLISDQAYDEHRHLARLWSLDKAQNYESLQSWYNRILKLTVDYNSKNPETPLPALSFALELKFDGLTLNLTYTGGELVQASTRGNGVLSVKYKLYKRIWDILYNKVENKPILFRQVGGVLV